MRRRRRCRPRRSSSRRTCAIWRRPGGAGSGLWRASPSIGVCASWRPRGARFLLSGAYGALRLSLREGTGMVRIVQQSASFRSFFFLSRNGLFLFFFLIVMRCGCSQIPQTCSRFADSFSSFVVGSRRHYNTLSRHCDTIPVTSRLSVCASASKRSNG